MCPTSRGGRFIERSEGRVYRRLRDPEIVDGVQRGEADIGFLGSDRFEEWDPELNVEWVGDVPGCDFVLAARLATISMVENRLERAEPVTVATGNPVWLGKMAVTNGWRLNIRGVSGAAEAYGDIEDMVADLRVSGSTLRDNRLHEFRILAGVQLGLVYPLKEPMPGAQ